MATIVQAVLQSGGSWEILINTGEGVIWIKEQIRIEKIYPVASQVYGKKDHFVIRYVGPYLKDYFIDSMTTDPVLIKFDRKAGDIYNVWVDIFYMANYIVEVIFAMKASVMYK